MLKVGDAVLILSSNYATYNRITDRIGVLQQLTSDYDSCMVVKISGSLFALYAHEIAPKDCSELEKLIYAYSVS